MISTPDRKNFGNIAGQRFATLWRGADYQAFRGQLVSDKASELCRSCAVYSGTV